MAKYPAITGKILAEGLDNLKLEMLPQHLKYDILTEVGDILFKEQRYRDSAKAFALANNKMKLFESGDYLFLQGRFVDAAKFFLFSEDRKRIEKAGLRCIEENEYQLAYDLFLKTGNFQMLEFIKMNFMEKSF
jgi:hypothetical protein